MHPDLKSFFVSFYIWAFIVITMIPFFTMYLLIWVVTVPFDRKHIVTHYYTIVWTGIYLICNPGWKLQVLNRDSINRAKPYILVSNHQSIIDIALVLQIRINFKWVSKVELAGIPFVGWVIWMNNHILVRRGDKHSVAEMAEACKRTLQNGISVCMFPEGTRTRNNELQPFKEGAFILARDNGVPVLPIVIDGAGSALSKGGFWFRPVQTLTVSVLDEISVETIKSLDLEQLISHTRAIMSDALLSMRHS